MRAFCTVGSDRWRYGQNLDPGVNDQFCPIRAFLKLHRERTVYGRPLHLSKSSRFATSNLSKGIMSPHRRFNPIVSSLCIATVTVLSLTAAAPNLLTLTAASGKRRRRSTKIHFDDNAVFLPFSEIMILTLCGSVRYHLFDAVFEHGLDL